MKKKPIIWPITSYSNTTEVPVNTLLVNRMDAPKYPLKVRLDHDNRRFARTTMAQEIYLYIIDKTYRKEHAKPSTYGKWSYKHHDFATSYWAQKGPLFCTCVYLCRWNLLIIPHFHSTWSASISFHFPRCVYFFTSRGSQLGCYKSWLTSSKNLIV